MIPQFIQFFQPVIDVLMELGGSGRPSEVKEVIADKLNIPDDEKAKKESVRDGFPPIELVDGEKLLDMFETLELGLKPKKAFDVDENSLMISSEHKISRCWNGRFLFVRLRKNK